jgi:hypothetical protein
VVRIAPKETRSMRRPSASTYSWREAAVVEGVVEEEGAASARAARRAGLRRRAAGGAWVS